ncbi:hypothetical protein BH09BAC2_BH09BAC2_20820 [soil metagenome]
MRKVLLALAIILGISTASTAQTSSKMKMKDGVMMVNNKTMLCNHSTCTPLTKTYIFKNGSKVSPDGTVTKPDGTTMKLMNGYKIDKNGKVAMISHSMKGHVCGPDCPMMKGKM